jgi:hypothetical protein
LTGIAGGEVTPEHMLVHSIDDRPVDPELLFTGIDIR